MAGVMGERGRAEQQKDQNNPHHDRLPFSQKLRFCAAAQGKASMSCRVIHSAVGLVVTLIQTRSLRSIRTITKPYSSLKPMVGTTNRSMAAMSGAWFRRRSAIPDLEVRVAGPCTW